MPMLAKPTLPVEYQERLLAWYGTKVKYLVVHFWDTPEIVYCVVEILNRKACDFHLDFMRIQKNRAIFSVTKDDDILRWKKDEKSAE